MPNILYLTLSCDLQSKPDTAFWQAMTEQNLPGKQAYFADESSLLAQLTQCCGTWLLVIIGRSPNVSPYSAERQRLENQLSRLLVNYQSLSLTLAAYEWQNALPVASQAQRLAQLIHSPQQHRQCIAYDVEFDAEWSALPPYRYRLLLCTGARCARRGSARLWQQLTNLLEQQGLLETAQGVLLVKTHCQFPCNHGPIVTLYPGEYWYGIRQASDVHKLLEQHIKQGQPVKELLLDLRSE